MDNHQASNPGAPAPPVQNPQSPTLRPSFQTPVQQPVQQAPSFTPQPPSIQQPEPPEINTPKNVVTKIEQVIILTYFFVAALLLFRFVLSMFGARTSPFVEFVRQLTSPFMIPFANMFGGPIGVSNYRLEFEVLIAIVVYALIFFGLARLVKIIFK